jgi:guanylate kinase
VSLPRPAFPLVLAAPSGAGKTSVARSLLDRNPELVFSISATTRAARPREKDGRDYHFIDDAAFERMIERNELAEWAVVHGRRYGTPRREVTSALERGRTVVLDIDVQGARQVRRLFPHALLVFILTPSVAELDRRLSGRGSEGAAERRRRLINARRELDAAAEFDFVVVNDDLLRTVERVECIIRAEWTRVGRIPDLARRIGELQHDLDSLLGLEDGPAAR